MAYRSRYSRRVSRFKANIVYDRNQLDQLHVSSSGAASTAASDGAASSGGHVASTVSAGAVHASVSGDSAASTFCMPAARQDRPPASDPIPISTAVTSNRAHVHSGSGLPSSLGHIGLGLGHGSPSLSGVPQPGTSTPSMLQQLHQHALAGSVPPPLQLTVQHDSASGSASGGAATPVGSPLRHALGHGPSPSPTLGKCAAWSTSTLTRHLVSACLVRLDWSTALLSYCVVLFRRCSGPHVPRVR